MKTPNRHLVRALLGTMATLVLGCASTTPTPELVGARDAYRSAQHSAAAELEPEHVLNAKQALDRAERAHRDDPGSDLEKHLGYLAQRKASMAIAIAGETHAKRRQLEARDQYLALSEQQRKRNKTDLDLASSALSNSETKLDAERQRRVGVEKQLRNALASLQEITMIKWVQEDLIITLDGAVLFAPGKSELMPIAKEKLKTVASALKSQTDGAPMVVKGHADSVENQGANLQLSQARANAVRAFLVSEGVAPDKLIAVGKGITEPVADNDSAEGRANNRRVEIVLPGMGASE